MLSWKGMQLVNCRKLTVLLLLFQKVVLGLSIVLCIQLLSAALGFSVGYAQLSPTQKTLFVDLLCSNESYFRKCFETTERICRNETRKAYSHCMSQLDSVGPLGIKVNSGRTNRTPASQRKKHSDYATRVESQEKLGLCVGSYLEKAWHATKSQASQCDGGSRWR